MRFSFTSAAKSIFSATSFVPRFVRMVFGGMLLLSLFWATLATKAAVPTIVRVTMSSPSSGATYTIASGTQQWVAVSGSVSITTSEGAALDSVDLYIDGGWAAANIASGNSFSTAVNLGAGTHSVTIIATTDTGAQGSASVSFTVAPPALSSQTITFDAISSHYLGDSAFSVNAYASSGLPVSLGASPSSVCSISGSTVSMVGTGTCTITANQAGNSSYNAAPQVSQSFTVAPRPLQSQSISFGALGNKTLGDPAFGVSASATSGLTVTFGSSTSSVCSVSGSTVSLVGTGTCTVTANQAGNSSYSAAPQVAQSFTVSPQSVPLQSQSITFNALSSKTLGDAAFTVSASATSNLTVTFGSTTSSICTVSGTTVSLVGAGTCTVVANQAGNSSYSAAPQVSQSFNVAKASQTITFSAISSKQVSDPPFSAGVSASSGLPVSLSATPSSVCTVSGTTITPVGVGSCSITANQSGNSNYNPAASVSQSITIQQAAGPVIGNIDTINNSGGVYYLSGWTCDKYVDVSNDVQLYVFPNGTGSAGISLSTSTANVSSEAAVATACGTPGSVVPHRFYIPLTNAQTMYPGKPVYVYGYSKSGGAPVLIPNSGSLVPPTLQNAAQFVEQVVPTTMNAGSVYSIRIRMKNLGSTTWTPSSQHKLGSQNPQDNTDWQFNRVNVSTTVAPQGFQDFIFNVTAPSTLGNHNFQWRMVQESVEWFGDLTQNVVINVAAPAPPPAVPTLAIQYSPAPVLVAGQSTTLSWTTTGADTLTRSCTSTGSGYAGTTSLSPNSSTVINAQQAWVGTPSTCTWTATGPGGTKVVTDTMATVATAPVANDAQFVSQTGVPATVRPGQPLNATIRMVNTGTVTWPANAAYKLGSQNPQDNWSWGSNRFVLKTPVAPGQTADFAMAVTAPQATGAYGFQWKMVQEYVAWFGNVSTNIPVTVAAGTSPVSTLKASPNNVRVVGTAPASVTLSGSGTESANPVVKVELFVDAGSGYGTTAIASNTGSSNSLSLSNVQSLVAGVYSFKLRSTDSVGNATESAPVIVNVTNSTLLGLTGGVRIDAQNKPQLFGWACEPSVSQALNYKVYLDAPTPASGGVQIASGVANLATESDNQTVQNLCNTPGVAHHFNVDLSAFTASYAGRSLFVSADSSNGTTTIALPCNDNTCTMPGSMRIGLTSPTAAVPPDQAVAPATVFMRALISGASAPFDEVAFSFDGGSWVAGTADTAAGAYFASQSNVAARATSYTVQARVRQGSTTVYSVANKIDVVASGSVTINQTSPVGGATVASGATVLFSATPGTSGTLVKGVNFYVNNALARAGTLDGNGAWTSSWSTTVAGSYAVQAKAVDSNGTVLASSTIANITVSGSGSTGTSDAPLPVVIAVPHLGNPDAGSLPGSLNVGQDGAASYSIALAVPPGTGGMEPKLSLSYSSNGSNGMVGLGWTLGGLSTIYRCAKTVAQDGVPGRISFDNADRLCLDGQRLVRADGTPPGSNIDAIDAAYWSASGQYRTENESFRRITRLANGGFKVEAKDGRIHYYGTNADGSRTGSTIRAQGRSDNQALVWALGSTTDRVGNYFEVDYTQDGTTGEYLPSQLRYGGNTTANQATDLAIRFSYEARGDAQVMYMGGSRNDMRSRLTHIQTYIGTAADGSGGTRIRDYTVHYVESAGSGRSLVDWVQACASTNECLPKTTFDWGKSGLPVLKPVPVAPFTYPMPTRPLVKAGKSQSAPIVEHYQGDLDGSGRTSFISKLTCEQDPNNLWNCPPDDTLDDSTDRNFNVLKIRLPNGQEFERKLLVDGNPLSFNAITSYSDFDLMVGDLNGDGRDDLVLMWHRNRQDSQSWWDYCLNVPLPDGTMNFDCHSGQNGSPRMIDLRNDRKLHLISQFDGAGNATDCYYASGTMNCGSLRMTGSLKTLTGMSANTAGFTNDLQGIELSKHDVSDIVMSWDTNTPVVGSPNSYNRSQGISLCFGKAGGLACQSVYQNDSVRTGGLLYADGRVLSFGLTVGDYNGDGLSDFSYFSSDAANVYGRYVCLSKENGTDCNFIPFPSSSNAQGFGPYGPADIFEAGALGDFVGDGVNRLLSRNYAPQLCRYTSAHFYCDNVQFDSQVSQLAPVYLDDSGVPGMLVAPYGIIPTSLKQWNVVTLAAPAASDKLTGITNGVGLREEIDYARGGDKHDDGSVVYTRFATIDGIEKRPVYPQAAISPGVIVKQLRRSTGQGNWLRSDYAYAGMLTDAQGRSSLGFAKMQVADLSSGNITTTTYSQDYPTTGMELRVQTVSRSGVLLSDVANTPDQQTFTLASGAQTVFTFVKHATKTTKDLDGSNLSTTITDNQYTDGWGNLTQQNISVSPIGDPQAFTSSTVSIYLNDPAVWLLGLPTSVTTTKGAPLKSSIVRTVAFDYDRTTGLLSKETIQPNDPLYQVVTDYLRNNNLFGLVNKKNQSWIDPATNLAMTRAASDIIYDTKGRFAVTVKNALGHTEIHGYDAGTGARLSLKGPNLLTTTWTIDGFGRVKVEYRADGNETRYFQKQCQGDCPSWAVVANISDTFHGADRIAEPTVIYSDSASHEVRRRTWGYDGRPIIVDRRYDSLGRLQETDQPHYEDQAAHLAQSRTLDDLNRVTNLVTLDEIGASQTSTIKYNGLITVNTNTKGQVRTDTHDALGQVVRVQADVRQVNAPTISSVTVMGYDPFGNLLSTTDPNGNVITVEYDTLGRKKTLIDPDMGRIEYGVDPIGRTWKQSSVIQRNKGQFTSMKYDLLDRMTARVEPDLESHWDYDSAVTGIGQLAEAYTITGGLKDYRRLHTYDDKGRPKAITQLLSDASYSSNTDYDPWGRVIRQTYLRQPYQGASDAAKVFDSRYNDKGYLSRIERGGSPLWNATALDAAQNVTQAALGNGLTVIRGYNANTGRLENSTLKTGANNQRLAESYYYDTIGNVTTRNMQWTDTNGTSVGYSEIFGYDDLNRLTKSSVTGQADQIFTYDAVGNLISKTGLGTYRYPTQGAGATRPHAISSIDNFGSFGYDENGNLTSAPGRIDNNGNLTSVSRSATWTSFDMPLTISKGVQGSGFAYGPEHQRTRQTRTTNGVTTSTVIYAGAQEVETANGQVTVKTYWPQGLGVEIDRPNAATVLNWIHSDRLGSPVAISDAQGALVEKLAYDAWGKRRALTTIATSDTLDGQVDNRGFTGHEMLDQLDLVHMNGRVYDPLIGKFLSADPLVQDPINGQNYNRYSYVLNNPTNATDPTGFACEAEMICSTSGRKEGQQADGDGRRDVNYREGARQDEKIRSASNRFDSTNSVADTFRKAANDFRAMSQVDLPWYRVMFGDPREEWAAQAATYSRWADAAEGDKIAIAQIAAEFVGAAVAVGTIRGSIAQPQNAPRTGPYGVDPNHHNANVTIRGVDGRIRVHDRVVSGNMTPVEKALGFPKGMMASHTEARAVTSNVLSKGETMTITGQLPPCTSCRGAMNRVATETGATIQYQWRANGETQTWTATPRN